MAEGFQHEDADGAKKGGQSLGRYGFSIHAADDAHPIRFSLTGRDASDYTQTSRLLKDLKATATLADKSYDCRDC